MEGMPQWVPKAIDLLVAGFLVSITSCMDWGNVRRRLYGQVRLWLRRQAWPFIQAQPLTQPQHTPCRTLQSASRVQPTCGQTTTKGQREWVAPRAVSVSTAATHPCARAYVVPMQPPFQSTPTMKGMPLHRLVMSAIHSAGTGSGWKEMGGRTWVAGCGWQDCC